VAARPKPPPPTDSPARPRLAARQSERRERLLETTIKMAAEGGYEAVQMRETAVNAGLSLGTLYRYYGSKDALLAAAWGYWSASLEPQLGRRPLRGATMAERAYDFLRRTTRAFERSPRLAEAFIVAANSNDPYSAQHREVTVEVLGRILESAMTDIDATTAGDIRITLDHVWNSSLQHWVSGRYDMQEVYASLERACHLLLDPREPKPARRPSRTTAAPPVRTPTRRGGAAGQSS
jgi:AcrR family transcriptional regulator